MSNFRKNQLPKWKELLNEIFNNNIPTHCEWTDINAITNILNTIGTSAAANHTFFPISGGLDLCGCIASQEHSCIELNFDGLIHILKPNKLIFQSFNNADSEWFYFRIVSDILESSEVYDHTVYTYEEVVELSPLTYVERHCWDCNEYNGETLPPQARPICRVLNGDFVIFSKASLYNQVVSTYDGEHDKLGAVGFKEYLKGLIPKCY